ncbi:MAG TPA: ATP-binding protein [Candidatus Altiarchaeales archaeon]|nr:ATP-binding protein [Candidatus Altiarchaeales archaeon]
MKLLDILMEFNPWWETGRIQDEFSKLKRREIFFLLKETLEKRMIEVIVGLRRVGKTVLMLHLIDFLLEKGVEPRKILYFSFDVEKKELDKILREYEEKILRKRIKQTKVYLFLDEIHKLENWEEKIKVLYDFSPKAKIVLSGSASLNLMKKSRESLAGRAKFHHLTPLTFREFLRLRGEEIPKPEEYEIHKRKLDILLQEFIWKGFPETLEMNEKEAKEYAKELVVERIIFRDIPENFRIEDVEIVRLLTEIIFRNPGIILNIDSLSRDFGRHKKTIRNALSYIELSFLIKKVSNLRGSFLAISRKNRKGYPFHPSLCLTEEEDKIIESLVRSELGAKYYWRKGANEVDFVLKNERILPIEVKNIEKVDKRDLKSLIKFLSLFNLKRGYLVNKEEEGIIRLDGKKIIIVPITKFLLYEKY